MGKSAVRTEKYQLPATVDGICALVREILSGGHVKRLELDNDDALARAYRWIEETGLVEDEVTWDGALRNVPAMVEYYSDGATSFQVVVDMMLLAQDEGLHCSCWVVGVGGTDLLRKWFEVDRRKLKVDSIDSLLGFPVYPVKSLPPETLILCCSKYPSADPTEVSMAIKTSIDLGRERDAQVNEDASRGRNHTQECPPATGQLALNPRGLRRIAWRPPDSSASERPKDGSS